MSDLDLTNFINASAGPAKLDWLDVDEQSYRSKDQLPRQNLDIIPDLKAQWAHQDEEPLVYFVPNRDMAGYPVDPGVPDAPHTMGDLSHMHGPLHKDHISRTARLALIQSDDPRRWQETMTSKFARDDLAQNVDVLSSALSERGLLGRLYVAAEDFPGCATSNTPEAFVRKFAGKARYVLAKQACGDCCHKQSTTTGGDRCGVFHKEIVSEIPYSDELAAAVERDLSKTASLGDPKDRIKAAFLGKTPSRKGAFSGQDNSAALIPASRLARKAPTEKQASQIEAVKARPVVAMVRRELLKGRALDEIAHGLRLAFDLKDLQETKDHWSPLLKEAGLYGSVYSTQESFDDCREGADFLSRHGSKVRVIVAGEKCSSCIFSKVGRCMMYGKKLVAKVEDAYTPEMVASVLDEAKLTGAISPALVNQKWGLTPREALQNIHRKTASRDPVAMDYSRLSSQAAFHGGVHVQKTGELTKREIVKTASRYMNEGLFGSDLQRAMQAKFDPRDLVASSAELKTLVAANQGLQGIYFIDPTIYDDYGKGCKEAQRLHRTRAAVRYAKVGDKCASCVHQTRLGVCSVLNKRLTKEPPYQDKLAQQRAMLATGSSVETNYESLINNGLTMMEEFELKNASGDFDLNPTSELSDVSIQFGNNELGL